MAVAGRRRAELPNGRSPRRPSEDQIPTLPDRRELAAISAGGAIGALARVALAQTGASGAPGWPWITFAVNIVGAFLLGYFVTRLQERLPLSAYRRPLLGTGFCGAFTTFSTMQVELLMMLDAHRYGLAAGYAGSSRVLGYTSVHLGTAFARRAKTVA
jgi:fluoride exporter